MKTIKLTSLSLACILSASCAKVNYQEDHLKPFSVNTELEKPGFSLAANNSFEMYEGETKIVVIKLQSPATSDSQVDWKIVPQAGFNTVKVDTRFKKTNGTVSLKKGDQFITLTIPASDVDKIKQGDQLFYINLINKTENLSANADLKLIDKTQKSDVGFSNTDIKLSLNNKNNIATLKLNEPSDKDVTVEIETQDQTAVGGKDYTPIKKTVVIPAGKTSIDIPIEMISTPCDKEKTFLLVIKKVTGATMQKNKSAQITIPSDSKVSCDPVKTKKIELTSQTELKKPIVKVVFVIDNSLSMEKKHTLLAEGMKNVISNLKGNNVDFLLYTTTNDIDEDHHGDKRTITPTESEVTKGKIVQDRSLSLPFQKNKLSLRDGMTDTEIETVAQNFISDVTAIGSKGSKNEAALCTLNNILQEPDPEFQVLKKGDYVSFVVLSDTDDHTSDVSAVNCGQGRRTVILNGKTDATQSIRLPAPSINNIISKANSLLGSEHYNVTGIISLKELNKNEDCDGLILDEAAEYKKLISSTTLKGSMQSICSKDYSKALDSVKAFITKSTASEYTLKLSANETISKVILKHKSSTIEVGVADYKYANDKLNIKPSLIQEDDVIEVIVNIK